MALQAGCCSISGWLFRCFRPWLYPPCTEPAPCCRVVDAADKQPCGVAGTVEEIAQAEMSTQPVCAFDWSPDRLGLFACAALDQSVYVGIATNLQTA